MKIKSPFIVASTAVMLFSALAKANLRNPIEIGPQIGYFLIEGDSDLKNTLVYGARFTANLQNSKALELSVLGGKSDIKKTDRNSDFLLPTLELQKYYPSQSKFKPYLSAGIGYLQFNRDRSVKRNDIDFAALYGIGVKWPLSKSFLARLDGRHVIDTESGKGTHNGLLSAGISWVYGNEEPEATPEPVKKKTVEAPPAPPKDSDNDGILDVADVCPDTPEGMKVDSTGCPLPLDLDEDGVVNDKDDCPDTLKGTKVDQHGCPENVKAVPEAEWVLSGVRFESNSAKLTTDSLKVLNEAALTLVNHSKVRVEIQGHTDKTGTAEVNQKLSEARALAVKDYLVKNGVSSSRLETKGFGFTKPIASNQTAEGRAKNRRIEFKVLSR